MKSSTRLIVALGAAFALAAPAAAQQVPDDDKIMFMGCVARANSDDTTSGPRSLLVWSDGDVFLADGTMSVRTVSLAPSTDTAPVGTTGTHRTELYWLDDAEDELEKYIGQSVEITAELDELEDGEIKIERKGNFTEIEFDAQDEKTARVPTAWLGPNVPREAEYDIQVREVDIESVRVLSTSCVR